MKIILSSCKLLNFNVEDIMALPSLKEGKFSKNTKNVNIVNSIKEIRGI